MATDISHRVEAEAALRHSEERFRNFSNIASDWFWEMDATLRLSWFSDSATVILGFDSRTLLGKRRGDLAIDEELNDREKWHKHLDDLEHHRSFRNFEYLSLIHI